MSHDKKLRSQKAGLEPGSLVHLGEVKTSTPTLMLLEYDSNGLYEQELSSREQVDGLVRRPGCTLWLNVYGLQDPDLMAAIGKRFGLHPLVLEDILNTDQRPKVDDYEDYLYLVARLFDYVPHSRQLASDQVSIILGKDFVLTFQERPSGTFGALRERLRANRNQVRRLGADYLAYSLLDSLVDRYFALVEQVGDHAEILETSLINRRPHRGYCSPSTGTSGRSPPCAVPSGPCGRCSTSCCAAMTVSSGRKRCSTCATSTITPSI